MELSFSCNASGGVFLELPRLEKGVGHVSSTIHLGKKF